MGVRQHCSKSKAAEYFTQEGFTMTVRPHCSKSKHAEYFTKVIFRMSRKMLWGAALTGCLALVGLVGMLALAATALADHKGKPHGKGGGKGGGGGGDKVIVTFFGDLSGDPGDGHTHKHRIIGDGDPYVGRKDNHLSDSSFLLNAFSTDGRGFVLDFTDLDDGTTAPGIFGQGTAVITAGANMVAWPVDPDVSFLMMPIDDTTFEMIRWRMSFNVLGDDITKRWTLWMTGNPPPKLTCAPGDVAVVSRLSTDTWLFESLTGDCMLVQHFDDAPSICHGIFTLPFMFLVEKLQ